MRGARESSIQRRASACAPAAASAADRKNRAKRSTRSVVADPDPERIETELENQPSSNALTKGETRYLPTRCAPALRGVAASR